MELKTLNPMTFNAYSPELPGLIGFMGLEDGSPGARSFKLSLGMNGGEASELTDLGVSVCWV